MKFVVLGIILLLAVIIVGGLLFIFYSPWPAVWLIRSRKDGPLSVPEDFEAQTKGVAVKKDLSYPSSLGKNRFDLYLPPKAMTDHPPGAPLIVWVHGGAFVAGDKEGISGLAALLASRGYAVAAMNYQWAPEAPWPSQTIQVYECLKALEKLSEQGEPLDMGRFFLAGDSAGAHVAVQAATAWFNEDFAAVADIHVDLDKSRAGLKGLLLYCGPYELEAFSHIENRTLRYLMNKVGQSFVGTYHWKNSEKIKYLNVIPWMTAKCPPVYITDGNHGSFEKQGKNLAQALEKLKVPVTRRFFAPEEGVVGHGYEAELRSAAGLQCFSDTEAFLKKYKN